MDRREQIRKTRAKIAAIKRRRPHLGQGYRPQPHQMIFHAALKKYRQRIFRAANQSGKSFAGLADVAMQAMDLHPYARRGPKYIRIVPPTLNMVGSVEWPRLKLFLPPEWIAGVAWERKQPPEIPKAILIRRPGHSKKNGSLIEFLCTTAGREHHQGWTGDCVLFDEEPPQDIFIENTRGLMARGGNWMITYTPIIGRAWIRELENDTKVFIVRASTYDNKAFHSEHVDDWRDKLDPRAQRYRVFGEFGQAAGLVYNLLKETHGAYVFEDREVRTFGGKTVSEWPIPEPVFRAGATDFGWTNPFSYTHSARIGRERLLVMACFYQREMYTSECAKVIKGIWDWDRVPDRHWADPEDAEGRATLRKNGVKNTTANNDLKSGIEDTQSLFRVKSDGLPGIIILLEGQPEVDGFKIDGWPIMHEAENYRFPEPTETGRRDVKDTPIDSDNHALDTIRYQVNGLFKGYAQPKFQVETKVEDLEQGDLFKSLLPAGKNYSVDKFSGDNFNMRE